MLSAYPDGRPQLPPLAPPMLAREVEALPHGEDWMYEYLWSGERVRAVKRDASVQLLSRDNRDVTNRFPRLAAAVAKVHLGTAIIDGEILHLDAYAEPVRRLLADTADEFTDGGVVLVAYDLLAHEGKDVRAFSLLCRRLLLASVVQGTPLLLSPLIDGNSEVPLAAAERRGFRGVMAKRAGSPYRPNSLSSDWRKITFAPPRPSPRARVAVPPPDPNAYAGRSGGASWAGPPLGFA